MSRGRGRSGGYTIVETMIFLAVTGMIFMSAMIFVGGQQRRTEFNQGVRDFASDLQSIAGDVSTGYTAFPFRDGEYCWTNGTDVVVGATAGAGYQHCIFIGRALQFGFGNDMSSYKVYSIIGRQHNAAGQEVQALDEPDGARALLLARGTTYNGHGDEYASEAKKLGGGLTVGWVHYGSPASSTTTLSLITTFAKYSGATPTLNSSSIHVNLYPVATATNFAEASTQLVNRVDTFLRNPSHKNDSIKICLNSGGTNQHAEVNLGGSGNGALQVTTVIKDGAC